MRKPCWADTAYDCFLGGFKVQGKVAQEAKDIYEDAFAIQEAGGFGFEIEAVPSPIAEQIANQVDIIAWGIGAGVGCDGQILIAYDMLGLFDAFTTKFGKRYATLAQTAINAISEYAEEVRKGDFPGMEYTYSIDEKELTEFRKMIGKR